MTFGIPALDSLLKTFLEYAEDIQARRFAMGDIVNKWLAANVPMPKIVRILRSQVPNAKHSLGYVLSEANLRLMSEIASTFEAEGYIQSPDLKHQVQRADIEALGLTLAETGKVADMVKSGDMRVKSLNRVSKAIQKHGLDSTEGKNAQAMLRSMLTNGNDSAPTEVSLEALITKRDKLRKSLADVEAEIAKRVEALPKAQRPVEAAAPVEVRKPRARGKSAPTLTA